MSPKRPAATDALLDAELEVYAAEDPTVVVGGETFTIRAMTPRQSFRLTRILTRALGGLLQAGQGGDLLAGLGEADYFGLVTLILSRPEREIDADWLEAHAAPVDMLNVIDVWSERSDVRDFLGKLQTLMRKAQGMPTTSRKNGSASPASAA